MAKVKEIQISEEEEMELYRAFYQKMLEEGYSHEYIGEKLAIIAHAIYTSTNH